MRNTMNKTIEQLNAEVVADREKHYKYNTTRFVYTIGDSRGADVIPPVKVGKPHILGGSSRNLSTYSGITHDIPMFPESEDMGLTEDELTIWHMWRSVERNDKTRSSHL